MERDSGPTLEGVLTAATETDFTLEWKQREPKPVGKGKQTVIKKEILSYQEIKSAKVLVNYQYWNMENLALIDSFSEFVINSLIR